MVPTSLGQPTGGLVKISSPHVGELALKRNSPRSRWHCLRRRCKVTGFAPPGGLESRFGPTWPLRTYMVSSMGHSGKSAESARPESLRDGGMGPLFSDASQFRTGISVQFHAFPPNAVFPQGLAAIKDKHNILKPAEPRWLYDRPERKCQNGGKPP